MSKGKGLLENWLQGKGMIPSSGSSSSLNGRLLAAISWILRLPSLLLISLTMLSLLFSLSGAGNYLNTHFFYNPMIQLRAQWGMQPTLNSDLKIVLVEDNSLARLGRFPNFGEWHQIARKLFDQGIEKIFMLGLLSLEADVGELGPRHQKGKLFTGAVPYPYSNNSHAFSLKTLDKRMLSPLLDPNISHPDIQQKATDHEPVPTEFILTQHSSTHPYIDGLGHLNLGDNNVMQMAYKFGDEHIVPHIAALLKDDVHWRQGAMYAGDEVFPASHDHEVIIDFVDFNSVLPAMIPVFGFFDKQKNYKAVSEEFVAGIQKRLAGARHVVFVKEGYQGSRFVDTPFGQQPSFMSIVSMMNSVLSGFYLHRPVPDAWLLFAAIPLLVLLFTLPVAGYSLAIGIVLTIAQVVLSGWLMLHKGWVLPAAEIAVLGLVAAGMRFVHYSMQTLREKLTLNRDLEMGKTVQSLLIPSSLEGEVAGWQFKFLFQPFGAMSGDWINIYQSPPQAPRPFAVFAVGDVVGKGPSAALNTAVIAGIWNHFKRSWDRGEFSMDEFIAQLNRIISETFQSNQNTTLSLAYADEQKLLLASCGAPSWIRIQPGGKGASVRGLAYDPVGLQLEDVRVKTIQIDAELGEVFVAHTDGVMEGSKVRKNFLKVMKDLPQQIETDKFFAIVEETARKVGQDEVLPDDFTMLMIRRIASATSNEWQDPQQKVS